MIPVKEVSMTTDFDDELVLLKRDIAQMRSELFKVINDADEYLTDQRVIQISQQLDGLLVKYIRISKT